MPQYQKQNKKFIPTFEAKELKQTLRHLLSSIKPHVREVGNKTAQDAIDRTVMFLLNNGCYMENDVENFSFGTRAARDFLFNDFLLFYKKDNNGKRTGKLDNLLIDEAQVAILASLSYAVEKHKNLKFDNNRSDFNQAVFFHCKEFEDDFKTAIGISQILIKKIRHDFFCIKRNKEKNDGRDAARVDEIYDCIEQSIEYDSLIEASCLCDDIWPLIESVLRNKHSIDYEITSAETTLQYLLNTIKNMDYFDKVMLLTPLNNGIKEAFSWLQSCSNGASIREQYSAYVDNITANRMNVKNNPDP